MAKSQYSKDVNMNNFDAKQWLSKWTDAGGGFAAGSGTAHLIRPPCQCAKLEELASELSDPDRKEALAEHIRNGQ
jgi:hypothetical protein